MTEVSQLLEASGFSIEWIETRTVYGPEFLNEVPLLGNRRDNIFALARSSDGPRAAFPPNLYSLMDEYRNVVRSSFRMGLNEVGQIGRGWHDFEAGEPGFRWTAREAEFFLKNQEGSQSVRLRARSDHPKTETGLITVALEVNGRELGAEKLTDHSWHDLAFDLSGDLEGEAAEKTLRCRIKVSETWVPKLETNADDSRELGIAVSKIWLE